MDDFLRSAKCFSEPPQIRSLDLGVALFLEHFSWPLLRFTNYVPLACRMPDMTVEFKTWIAIHPLSDMADETLDLIGQGLYRRWKERRRVKRLTQYALAAAVTLHLIIGIGAVTNVWLIVGWLSAVAFASMICNNDRHWNRMCRTSANV